MWFRDFFLCSLSTMSSLPFSPAVSLRSGCKLQVCAPVAFRISRYSASLPPDVVITGTWKKRKKNSSHSIDSPLLFRQFFVVTKKTCVYSWQALTRRTSFSKLTGVHQVVSHLVFVDTRDVVLGVCTHGRNAVINEHADQLKNAHKCQVLYYSSLLLLRA